MSYFRYWGPFVWMTEVKEDFVKLLLDKGEESKEQNSLFGEKLVAGVDKEYQFNEKDWFLKEIEPYLNEYYAEFKNNWTQNFEIIDNDNEWYLNELWINYQERKEYLPPHVHFGDLSFVIWVKIPEELKKELQLQE